VTSGTGISIEELSKASGVTMGDIEGIESGYQPSINASFAKLKKYGDEQGFKASGPAATGFERIERRSASYLAARGDSTLIGARVGIEGTNCFTCHWNNGQAPGDPGAGSGALPIAWAPDLVHSRERLREDWTHDWLWNPSAIYPGTSMPANFAGSPPEWQEQYPGSDNDDQIQAVLDWLYNFDQISSGAQN
jgi:hypothetical protein